MTRIVGGQEATPHSLPWQVTLLIRRTYFNGKVSEHAYCGGSLISREWIATAAHCAKDKYPAEDMRIWLGSHDLTKQESSRVKRSVIKKIQNPHYNAPTTDYDIALLQLDKAVEFNEYVRPICLPEAQKRAIEGSQSLISGWGTLSFRGNTSPTLQVAVVPIVSRETCNSLRSYHGQITTRMLCAGYTEGGVDTCQGDSGGPLATQVKNSDKFELTGVVSWGAGCARQYKYGVYTDVSYFRDWIDKMVNQYSRL
ncbi:uncharacterized protein TRIADDRAFT_26286 [Trichoplax adhaerens]|uniref:Peptidase S1 domain-containing protein n=1 Tax=Trichoplax adhaerens TaxID=10228 RepID=B3RZF9_TRIAD|nr:hypothetical protein TRIADDRAFT_26286 [Trichoplax adhaerens]EDV23835.1 hypothetical protein TRIADDRAFT_26286 [Trichoplax adhaerens]|eukprot:XP_002113361.1 hypothetical protein TRIADDRAFT_26286 [Trichoplax adhaerens]